MDATRKTGAPDCYAFRVSFMLLSLGFAVMNTSIATIVLTAFLLVLSVAYIIHYYRLENGVQRCYLLSGEIKKRMEL